MSDNNNEYKAVKITDNLYWVGAVDWDVRDFHGHSYSVHRGTTYNAYLIIDEKITLVDTVYTPFAGEMISKISSVIDPSKIEYIIANHVEVDHSGSLSKMAKIAPRATIFCTAKGKEGFLAHYSSAVNITPDGKPSDEWNFHIIKSLEELKLGKKTLTFIEAPFLHWPDSMFTYIKEDAILLPNDAFGQHLASSGRFDDEVSQDELIYEAKKYFANILTPFSPLILKKIDELSRLKIPVKMICPSHGIIWRKNPGQIIESYRWWSEGENKNKILVIYDTMWGSTEKMARTIIEGILSAGTNTEAKLYKMPVSDRSDIMAEILDASGVIIGSSTLNKSILPTMAPLLEDLEGLRFKNKTAAAFGAFGWSGGAVETIEERLKKAGFSLIEPPVVARWVPDQDILKQCLNLGKEAALKISASAKT